MDAAILAIGTELTRGELRDSNSAWLSERLNEMGVAVREHVSVEDDTARIAAALLRLASQVDVVISTGGLGPTSDDLTSAAAAAALGVPLERDPGTVAALEARYRRAGRPMPAANLVQADFPTGSEVLENAVGTAPGFRYRLGRATCFTAPGVPREMQHIFDRHIEPWLATRVRKTSYQVHLKCYGLPESVVAERVADFEVGGPLSDPAITLGYRASLAEVELKVLAQAENVSEAQRMAEGMAARIRERLEPHVFGGRGERLAQVVGDGLRAAGFRLALAESCTGGWIAKLLTDSPGSSDFLVMSAVVYANEAKRRLLDVPGDLLDRHGAVSAEVAAAMAEGALRVAGTDLAVAVTGIAGPGGGSPEKPVGTVWFGLARREQPTYTERRLWPLERDRVRLATAQYALGLIHASLHGRLTPSRPDL